MREMPPDAIAEVRNRYDGMADLSDEQVASLLITQWTNLSLRLRDFGRAFLAGLGLRR